MSSWITDLDAALAYLNYRHAVISDYRGKCVVVTEWPPKTPISIQSFADFRRRYSNQYVYGPQFISQRETVAKFWLEHPNRLQYETLNEYYRKCYEDRGIDYLAPVPAELRPVYEEYRLNHSYALL